MSRKNKNYKEYVPPRQVMPWQVQGLTPDYERNRISDTKKLDDYTKEKFPELEKAPLQDRLMHMISDRQETIEKLAGEIERLKVELEKEKKAHILTVRRYEKEIKRMR